MKINYKLINILLFKIIKKNNKYLIILHILDRSVTRQVKYELRFFDLNLIRSSQKKK
jgi:hypothetical protein